ncbi:MAG: t-SNARE [Benjaminiella poitrasii]|nr:MAG: t-SNARE [Benjaminiella poitrasii]
MSYSFTRDRTAELRQSFEGGNTSTNPNEANNNSNTATRVRPSRPTSRYYSGHGLETIHSYNQDYNLDIDNTINATTTTTTNTNTHNNYVNTTTTTPTPTTNINNEHLNNSSSSSSLSSTSVQTPPHTTPTVQPAQQQKKKKHRRPEEAIEMTERPMQQPNVGIANINTLDGFFEEVEALKDAINMLNENVDAIERLHTAALESSNEQQWSVLGKQLQNMKDDTHERNMNIKKRLTDLEESNSKQPNNSDGQIRRTQFSGLKKRFMDSIVRYQDIERSYQQKYRQRIERQIKIVKPEASQDEIDDIIDNAEDDPQIFTQSIMQASRKGQSRAVLSEVEKRHDDIMNIEKTIVELHQLFMDMSLLVERQQETVTAAEQNAEVSAAQLEEGNKLVAKAVKTARSTRAKRFFCAFLCIGICVMIAILVWWFGFHEKGN